MNNNLIIYTGASCDLHWLIFVKYLKFEHLFPVDTAYKLIFNPKDIIVINKTITDKLAHFIHQSQQSQLNMCYLKELKN